jgi:hypothetical protein
MGLFRIRYGWLKCRRAPAYPNTEWAGHRSGFDFGEQPTSYDINDPDGRFLGAVPVPPIRILQIGDDFIAGVASDDFDVETVVVLPLFKPKR